jgi:hypothetical protein
MHHFKSIFLLEIQRLCSKRKLLLLLVLTLLILSFVNTEVYHYKQFVRKSEDFREVEAVKSQMLHNNTQYSIQGIKLLFLPSVSSVLLSDTSVMPELTARINQAVTLSIFNNLKSESLFALSQQVTFNFSGLILILGSLASLFLGFETLGNKKFLKSLLTITNNSTVSLYFSLILCRILALTASLLFISLSALFMVKMSGVYFGSADIAGFYGFFATALLVMLFFFLTGVLAGSFGKKKDSMAMALLLWISFVFLVPAIFETVIKRNANSILSTFKVEQKQLKMLTDFEKHSIESDGEFDRAKLEIARRITAGYLQNEYQTIRSYESQLRNQIGSAITFSQVISILSPATFYRMVCRETGSRGYENFLAFYDHLRHTHDGFVRFWLDRVLNHNPRKVVPYLKDRQLIFNGLSTLPSTFWPGIILLLLYNILLYAAGCRRLRRLLFLPEDNAPFKDKDLTIKLDKGKINAFFSRRPKALRDRLFQVLFAKRPFVLDKGNNSVPRVFLGDSQITGSSRNDGFIFICSPSDIPRDIKPIHLERFFHRIFKQKKRCNVPLSISKQPFFQLKPEQRASVLLELLPLIDGRLFLLDCFGKKIDKNLLVKLRARMSKLTGNNATVIYLSPCTVINDISTHKDRDIIPLPFWEQEISALGD